jgi:hypothetical protein
MALLAKVREFRENSKSSQKFAPTPWLFRETAIPAQYILIPKTSSERRQFFPLGFVKNCVVTNSALYMDGGGLYHFGVLCSTMHNAWVRTTCGRLKSDYRYSASIVYNNFPWPDLSSNQPLAHTGRAQSAIETAAQAVLDARADFPDSSLADLYDPLSMPPALVKAHQKLDAAVDKAYELSGGKKATRTTPSAWPICSSCTSSTPACCQPKRPNPGAGQKPFQVPLRSDAAQPGAKTT